MRHFEADCNLLIDNIELCSAFTTYNANIPGVAFTCNIKKNAVASIMFNGQNFEDYLQHNGIKVEFAEYNKDYGKDKIEN